MKIAISYADERFKLAQKYNSMTAKKVGGVDRVIEYSPNDIDQEFIEKNKKWFSDKNRRIGKYGLWRPYIVFNTLKNCNYGDYIFYSDSGTFFINKIDFLINEMEKSNEDLMTFELPFIEKEWTKRDVFVYLNADNRSITESNQRMSTAFLIKKSKRTIKVFKEYLDTVNKFPFLFTDEENYSEKENYVEFKENRHNQSVFSVIVKKHGYKAFKDPTEYGKRPELYNLTKLKSVTFKPIKQDSLYPQILVQHRNGKVTFKDKSLAFIRMYFPIKVVSVILFTKKCIKIKNYK